jgi:hypothetical protein
VLHRGDCANKLAVQDDYDKFITGIVLNLAASEARWLMMRAGMMMNMSIAKEAIAIVMNRFPEMGQLSTVGHEATVKSLLKEFGDGQ